MRTKDQGTLDKILKFVNKYYQDNRVAPTISEVASGVGVARSTTHRYIQELSDRDLLDYGRGILSAPESAKMKTAYIAAPLVGSIYCGSPEEEEENVEEYVSLPVSLFGKGDFYILRAKGDSMVDAGIAEGDLLVIERNCPASEGDIVVALDQEQQNTLKRYVGFDNDEKCFILAYENEARRRLYLLSCITTRKSRIPSPVKFPLFWVTAATILAGCRPSTQSPYLPSVPVWLVLLHRHS